VFRSIRYWIYCLFSLIILTAGGCLRAALVNAASNDNNVEWNGLFSDQGPLFMDPTEPTSSTPVTLRLRVFKGDITSANIRYWDTGDNAVHWLPMVWMKNDPTGVFDVWAGTVPASQSLKYYRFQINDGSATDWLNAVGITSTEPSSGDFWIVPGFHTPTWAKGAIYYQIFPDRFYDADPSNDLTFKASGPVPPTNGRCPAGSYLYGTLCAYEHHSWSELPEKPPAGEDFFGGDLAGVIAKIDPYLKDMLGVTALYLNPIFQSPSNHKYDTQDYTEVDPHFGTHADLQQLINTAHTSRNIRVSVLLDGVFNHTSTSSCWFDQQRLCASAGAAASQNSPFEDRYVFLHWPDVYCDWAGFTSLPKLNYQSPSLRDAIYRRSDSVMQMYLTPPYNADGWRYDVAGNLVSITSTPDAGNCGGGDDHALWQDIRPHVKAVNPEALMLGEEWGKASAWMNGKEWDSVMNYNGFDIPISKWIACQNVHGEEAGQCLSVSDLDKWLHGTLADYPRATQLVLMNSLSTHDTSRFLWRANGDEGKMKLAIIAQMTYVGAPAIYYGDEVGLTGDNDPDNRRTFNWNTTTWNHALLNLYRTLIRARKEVSAFTDGSFKTLTIDDTNKIYSYGRWNANSWAIVILNADSVGHQASVPAYQLSIPNGTIMTDKLTGTKYNVQNGTIGILADALTAHYGVVLVATPPGGTGM
jgi:alpha-glucosidase